MIPNMGNPLGKYWRQPSGLRAAPMDDESVVLTARQIDGLAEYSTSWPSGVYPGKCWKRVEGEDTYLCWYGEEEDGKCSVEYRKIKAASDTKEG